MLFNSVFSPHDHVFMFVIIKLFFFLYIVEAIFLFDDIGVISLLFWNFVTATLLILSILQYSTFGEIIFNANFYTLC